MKQTKTKTRTGAWKTIRMSNGGTLRFREKSVTRTILELKPIELTNKEDED